jgi:hypothetical protein
MSDAFHRPLRLCAAVLCLFGAGLAAVSAVLAFFRLGVGQGVAFAVVAAVLSVLAVGVLRAVKWVLAVSVVGLAAQLGAVVGAAWELAVGVNAAKAHQLREMGFDPAFGVAVNLGFSAVASALFGWFMVRWFCARRRRDAAAR